MTARALLFPAALLLAVIIGVRAAGAGADAGLQEPPVRHVPATVFLVRHAETEASTDSVRDPALSPGGAVRAKDLARLLGGAGVTHLFASQFERTQTTLAPLAAATGVQVTVVPAQDHQEQIDALQALPEGAVAVVCGHSNTVPRMVQALGGSIDNLVDDPRYGGMLQHDRHDRLFVVTLPRTPHAAPKAVELLYGQ